VKIHLAKSRRNDFEGENPTDIITKVSKLILNGEEACPWNPITRLARYLIRGVCDNIIKQRKDDKVIREGAHDMNIISFGVTV
jgi:hypothetical protein